MDPAAHRFSLALDGHNAPLDVAVRASASWEDSIAALCEAFGEGVQLDATVRGIALPWTASDLPAILAQCPQVLDALRAGRVTRVDVEAKPALVMEPRGQSVWVRVVGGQGGTSVLVAGPDALRVVGNLCKTFAALVHRVHATWRRNLHFLEWKLRCDGEYWGPPEDISRWAYMWTTNREEWCILDADDGIGTPFNRTTGVMLLVENTLTVAVLVERMLAAGIPHGPLSTFVGANEQASRRT